MRSRPQNSGNVNTNSIKFPTFPGKYAPQFVEPPPKSNKSSAPNGLNHYRNIYLFLEICHSINNLGKLRFATQ